MNKLYLILLFAVVSCYDDDSTVDQSADTAHRNSEMTSMIKSIAMHDATFDDFIDNTSCLSLVFPYQLNVNSNSIMINSIQDLEDLNDGDDIEIIYPITVAFFDYQEHEASTPADLNAVKNSCNQKFEIDPNSCLNFEFPLTVKRINEVNGIFDTIHLESDEEVFTYFDNLHDAHTYEIDYPINVINHQSDTLALNSNEEFKTAINQSSLNCQ